MTLSNVISILKSFCHYYVIFVEQCNFYFSVFVREYILPVVCVFDSLFFIIIFFFKHEHRTDFSNILYVSYMNDVEKLYI